MAVCGREEENVALPVAPVHHWQSRIAAVGRSLKGLRHWGQHPTGEGSARGACHSCADPRCAEPFRPLVGQQPSPKCVLSLKGRWGKPFKGNPVVNGTDCLCRLNPWCSCAQTSIIEVGHRAGSKRTGIIFRGLWSSAACDSVPLLTKKGIFYCCPTEYWSTRKARHCRNEMQFGSIQIFSSVYDRFI